MSNKVDEPTFSPPLDIRKSKAGTDPDFPDIKSSGINPDDGPAK